MKIFGLKGQTNEKPSYLLTGALCLLDRELAVSIVKVLRSIILQEGDVYIGALHRIEGLLGSCLDLRSGRENNEDIGLARSPLLVMMVVIFL